MNEFTAKANLDYIYPDAQGREAALKVVAKQFGKDTVTKSGQTYYIWAKSSAEATLILDLIQSEYTKYMASS